MLKQETLDQPNLQRYTQYITDNAQHLFALLKKIMDLKET